MRMRGLPAQWMQKYRVHKGERLPISTLFMSGLFVGIILTNLQKSFLMESGGILNTDSLYAMRELKVDGCVLFYECLKQRLGSALLLAVLSTTYLGFVVCGGAALWYGICGGSLLAISVLRYGLKGLLLIIVGLLPQFFLYVPAFVLLLRWGEDVYRRIYVHKNIKSETGKRLLPHKLFVLLGILALVVTGCVLEAYVNPGILRGLLKIF